MITQEELNKIYEISERDPNVSTQLYWDEIYKLNGEPIIGTNCQELLIKFIDLLKKKTGCVVLDDPQCDKNSPLISYLIFWPKNGNNTI